MLFRSRVMGLEVSDVRGPRRDRRLAEARWMAAYLGRQLGAISLARMGRYLHRDNSTLVRGVAGLEQRLENDKPARRRLASIVRQIRNTP